MQHFLPFFSLLSLRFLCPNSFAAFSPPPPPAAPPRPRSEVLAHWTPWNPLASFHPEASCLPRTAPTLPLLPWPSCPRPRLPSPQWSPTGVLPVPAASFTQTKLEADRAQTRGLHQSANPTPASFTVFSVNCHHGRERPTCVHLPPCYCESHGGRGLVCLHWSGPLALHVSETQFQPP